MTDAAPAAGGNKVVGAESAPAISAVLIVSALQDTYGLLVQHEGWWELTPNIFTLAGFALFFGLRRLNTAAGSPLDVETAALFVASHPSDDKAEVAADLRRMAQPWRRRRAGPASWLLPALCIAVLAATFLYAVIHAAGQIQP
jgi:hypothetical protein